MSPGLNVLRRVALSAAAGRLCSGCAGVPRQPLPGREQRGGGSEEETLCGAAARPADGPHEQTGGHAGGQGHVSDGTVTLERV